MLTTVGLIVALGGTSYAVTSGSGIPDPRRVFHACVDRATGAVRLVKSDRDCLQAQGQGEEATLGEFAVHWSATGPAGRRGRNGKNGKNGKNGTNGKNGINGGNGTGIVDRTRGSGPTATSNVVQDSTLTGNTWNQASNQLDTIIGQATIEAPSPSACPSEFGAFPSDLSGELFVDGKQVSAMDVSATGVTSTVAFFPAAYLFEPGTLRSHTITAKFSDACAQTSTARFKVTSVAVDVEGAS